MPKIFALRHQLAEQQARLHSDIKDRLSPTQAEVISHADFSSNFRSQAKFETMKRFYLKSIFLMIQGRLSDERNWQPQHSSLHEDWRAQGEEQPLELVTRRPDPGKHSKMNR